MVAEMRWGIGIDSALQFSHGDDQVVGADANCLEH
jgi:hypothetical protein